MDVPQFPLPPARNASILSVRNAGMRAVSFSFAPREHHARKQLGSNGRRKLHRRNTVNPRLVRQRGKCIRKRVTDLCLKMTDRNDLPPTISPDVIHPALPFKNENIVVTPSTISENISTPDTEINQPRQMTLEIVSTGAQTIHSMPYRLRFLPVLRDIVDNDKGTKKSSKFCKYLRFLGRLSLSQFGLLWLLVLWTMVGASAFYGTEGPRERYQTLQLKDRQKELAVSLAMELRQLQTKEEDVEPQWSKKVQVYMSKHEKILLKAVNAGYGEGGESGQLWTFPGCILFAISVLTTLGFGAPVPRTNAGRLVTVFFAGIGIPLHFLLVMNLGLLLATYIQIYAINHKYKHQDIVIGDSMPPVSRWIKVMPFLCIFLYYVIGVVAFGIARLRPFSASVLFPLDFTAAGGLATTSGHVRIFYGLYLEAAVTLASVAVAVFRVSTTQSLTNIGLKYDLLTCAKH